MCTPVATRQDSLPPSWKTDSLRFVILLAEHDEPSLAAKKKQRHVALKTAASTPKNRVWDFFGSPLGQIRSESDLSAETATGSVQFSYETASGQAYYYTRDHLGSVRELTNGSGTLLSRYSYDPYGRVTTTHTAANTSTPPIDATFQFTGDYVHATSGLNLTWYRAYDPNTGRWLSRDPLKNAEMRQGPNLYDYAFNDPVRYTDPDGRVIPVAVAAILLVGAGVDHEFNLVMACQRLNNNEQMFIRTPLTIMDSIFSGIASSIAYAGAGGKAAIWMVRVWKDNCGNCHSEWVIMPLPTPTSA